MWPYWALFLIPAILALQERVLAYPRARVSARSSRVPASWKAFALALVLMVGWRHRVGGDWWNFLYVFNLNANLSLREAVATVDPGYAVLEWMARQLGWGIHAVNLVCGVIFAAGLVAFCRNLPRPWLAMAVAVPYLVIVVAMGYTRQGVALGCIMIGLIALGRGRVLPFVLWTVFAATFHKSAVLLLPMAALAAARNRWWAAAWVAVVAVVAYGVFVRDQLEILTWAYIEQTYQSQGALVRLLMNAIPAALLLIWRQRFSLTLPQQRLWFWFAVASLAVFGAYFLVPSSTALDRMGLYLLPLQMVVFTYLPEVLGRGRTPNTGWVALAIAVYASVQFVWLNYAANAQYWLPYQFYPLTDQFWAGPR